MRDGQKWLNPEAIRDEMQVLNGLIKNMNQIVTRKADNNYDVLAQVEAIKHYSETVNLALDYFCTFAEWKDMTIEGRN